MLFYEKEQRIAHKKGKKRTRHVLPTVGGSIGKEIGMTLFWDRPIVCSHLASDSLWYDEVASLYFKFSD
jgi:hypothetical protein